jgi:hypothetical protein
MDFKQMAIDASRYVTLTESEKVKVTADQATGKGASNFFNEEDDDTDDEDEKDTKKKGKKGKKMSSDEDDDTVEEAVNQKVVDSKHSTVAKGKTMPKKTVASGTNQKEVDKEAEGMPKPKTGNASMKKVGKNLAEDCVRYFY